MRVRDGRGLAAMGTCRSCVALRCPMPHSVPSDMRAMRQHAVPPRSVPFASGRVGGMRAPRATHACRVAPWGCRACGTTPRYASACGRRLGTRGGDVPCGPILPGRAACPIAPLG